MWYDALIADEFIEYFSREDEKYYEVVQDKVQYMPKFEEFACVVKSISVAANWGKEGFPTNRELIAHFHRAKIGDSSPYDTDIELLDAEQVAVLILYPFWNRIGGSWEIDFLNSGDLKRYLLALYEKAGRG